MLKVSLSSAEYLFTALICKNTSKSLETVTPSGVNLHRKKSSLTIIYRILFFSISCLSAYFLRKLLYIICCMLIWIHICRHSVVYSKNSIDKKGEIIRIKKSDTKVYYLRYHILMHLQIVFNDIVDNTGILVILKAAHNKNQDQYEICNYCEWLTE
jgi:hypothetical protein